MDMFIDGTWQTAVSGETISINDPCTSLSFDTVPDAGSEDADIAIVAAKRAFDSRRTGDTKADKAIAESAMGTVKRITLELGGAVSGNRVCRFRFGQSNNSHNAPWFRQQRTALLPREPRVCGTFSV